MAAAYGVTLRTLRFYKSQKLLNLLRAGYNRLYASRDEIVLQLILKGRRLGFTLGEIAKFLHGADPGRKVSAHNIELVDLLDVVQVNRQLDLLERRCSIVHEAIEELRQKIS